MRLALPFAVATLCLLSQANGARANAQQDQQACMLDAQTVCARFIPDREKVAHCLIANRRRISPACRLALRHFK